MRELSATGFMSNRGRQNVASYLIYNLGVDWRHGAAHFEELLLDYDPCANWGNWVAAAGLIGGRINKFNTKKQLNDYDPRREYVNHWLTQRQQPSTQARMHARTRGSSRKVVLDCSDDTVDKLDMTLDQLRQEPKTRNGKGRGGHGKGGYDQRDENNAVSKKRRGRAQYFGEEQYFGEDQYLDRTSRWSGLQRR